MTSASSHRFLAARASIAKREGAARAGFRIVPPAGRFAIRIVPVVGETVLETLRDGSVRIRHARLFHAGGEIDGATVHASGAAAGEAVAHMDEDDASFDGEAIVGDDGYVLVACAAAALPMAA